ncbi:MAG: hypothetical protein Q9159_005052 [Coniocarpon cinnabarinum]
MAARSSHVILVSPTPSHLYHRPRRRIPDDFKLLSDAQRYQSYYHRPRLRIAKQPDKGLNTSTRPFSTSSSYSQSPPPDHYATLDLPPTASSKEIKSQFYSLSKQHHPDVTRNLPESEAQSHRAKFEAVSDAYHVLGDTDRKSKYDRERNPTTTNTYTGGSGGAAQYSRGGRPASGLSRRRSTFTGPPPSFYRSGGWGTSSGARRRKQDAEDTGNKQRAYARTTHFSDADFASSKDENGWPFSTDSNDVPHFDRAGHYRTTTNVEEQLRQGRQKRRNLLWQARAEAIARGSGGGSDAIFGGPEEVGAQKEVRSFATVAALLLVGCGGGYVLFGRWWV